jgi:hypothetical protein
MCGDLIIVLLVRYSCELCNRGRDSIGNVHLGSTRSENLRGLVDCFARLCLSLLIVLEIPSWKHGVENRM